jgi:hypothetical protein
MLSQDFSTSTMKKYILSIVQEHAETILGAGVTDEEAIKETSKFILELQRCSTKQEDERSLAMDIEILPAPPAVLPDLIPTDHSCNYCYTNSFCMLFSRCDIELSNRSDASQHVGKNHVQMLQH